MHTLRRAIVWCLISFATTAFHRLIFAVQFYQGEPLSEAMLSYLVGFRFDLVALPIICGPYLLLLAIADFFSGRIIQILKRVLIVLQILWLVVIHMSLYASTFNFGFNEKLLGWEYFAYLEDLPNMMRGVLEKNAVQGVLYLAIPFIGLAIAFFITRRFVKNDPLRNEPFKLIRSWQPLWYLLALIPVFLIALRGGVQQSPIRTADAMKSNSQYLNNLKLNGIFTVLNDSRDSSEFKKYFGEDENIDYVNALLGSGLVSKEYPLMRKMAPRVLLSNRPVARPNVVLVVIESFTAKYLEAHGFDPSAAPEFNALVRKGVYFQKFYATGGRSANGLISMLAGIPDRAGRTILRSAQIQNRFGGLAQLMKDKGYRTFFVHGGDLKFDNLNTALPHLGFENSFGRDEIQKSGYSAETNLLGYDDRDTLRFMLTQMDKPGPFFGVVFTQNTHYPYIVPPDAPDYSKKGVQDLFLASFRYVDSILGEWTRIVENRPYGRDTILLFVADHTSHAGLNYMEDRNIPFLVYAPSLFAPRKNYTTSGQLDILPTVLSLAGGNTYYSAMGSDLAIRSGLVSSMGAGALEPQLESFAYFAGGSNTNAIGIVQDGRIAVTWLNRNSALMLKSDPPLTGENLAETEKDKLAKYLTRTKHLHQYARTLEQENRIWPDPDKLNEITRANQNR